MTTEPQAQTSERERLIAERDEKDATYWRKIGCYAQSWSKNARDVMSADAAQIRDLQAKMAACEADAEHIRSVIHRMRAFANFGERPDEWLLKDWANELDRSIAATHAPRSEAGED